MQYSIVIPFYNEEGNIASVLAETRRTNPHAEIIAVNDGSNDSTEALLYAHPDVRVLSFPNNLGQSAALYAGLLQASHEVCVMMDGDGQNDPADIPRLLSHLADHDVVCGYRRERHESWQVKLASRIANRVRQAITHDGMRDAGCTLKALRREHLVHVIPFSQFQCYMVAMLRRASLRIYEVPVNHRARKAGRSNYTIAHRAWGGIWDLIGVHWLLRRRVAWPAGFLPVPPLACNRTNPALSIVPDNGLPATSRERAPAAAR